MLNQQGFNLWANEYDKTVELSEENNKYPFAGYKAILNTIYNEIIEIKALTVLDIGFGTGILTNKVYAHCKEVDGIDFSSKMIEIAKTKMPNANLIKWDLSNGLPESIKKKKYDAVISTYVLHHFKDEEKAKLVKELLLTLNENGKIYIGDIAFESEEHLNKCKQISSNWDNEEFYFIYEDFKNSIEDFCNVEFQQLSHCGGVFIISKKVEHTS